MMRPLITSGITFTNLSPWIWHIYVDGQRVGTVSRDGVSGFVARDIDHRSIGGGPSAEAAMQVWVRVGPPALTDRSPS